MSKHHELIKDIIFNRLKVSKEEFLNIDVDKLCNRVMRAYTL